MFTPFIISFFLLLLFYIPLNYPQVDFRMNGEFGFYKSTGEETFKQNDILTRLDGSLKYNYENETRKASVQLRARPEFYRFKNSIASVKMKAEGNYSEKEEDFTWGGNLSRQLNFFNGRGLNIDYDILLASANFELPASDENSFSSNAGYGYQIIDNQGKYKLDLFFVDAMLFKSADRYFKYGYGIYLERFMINSKSHIIIGGTNSEIELMNQGWRYGPELSLSFLKSMILTADYRFIIHESKYTKNLSYEHWIRFVAGVVFLNDWSVFILADYYSRKFRIKGNPEIFISPIYSSLNLENRVYLKLARTISNNLELYSKVGYFKDNLYENEFSIEGWNLLLGIELDLE